MVDVRQDVCGIIVGGSPAPGVNGVISAIVLQCLEWDIVPIGFLYGFKHLREGKTSQYVELKKENVTRLHNRGGSIICTSHLQLITEEHIDNCIHALHHLRVKYLVTFGGKGKSLKIVLGT